MKKCPNCGAQVDDNSLFCTECGKQIPQDNVCPHCGASVNSGDSFCQNCGKSLKEIPNSESISYEEEPKSGFKKYLPYILGGVILLGIIGYCFLTKDDNSTDTIAIVDSANVEEAITSEQEIQAKKDFIEAFYQGFDQFNDSYIKKYVSPKALQILKDEYDYECEDGDCLATWLFKETCSDCGDNTPIISLDIKEQNENDYLVEIKFEDYYYGIFEYDVLLTVIKDGDTYKIDNIEKKRHTHIGTKTDTGQSSKSSNDYSSSSSQASSSLSKTFANEQYVTMYLANQTFRSNDGLAIRFDGNLRMYVDGDYAGAVSVLRFNSTSALLRYGGGAYGDGRITVQIVGDKLQLTDPEDGSVYHQN